MNFALTRKLIVFGLVLPLAAIIGFSLATPLESKTFLLMAFVTGMLLLPVMLKWYHPLLIFIWNASINVYFLPGRPELWMVFSVIGLGIAILNRTLSPEREFIHVPAITWPLLFLLGVVLITAKLTGGIGTRTLGGSTYGGKNYFFLIFATMGYFALTSKALPPEKAKLYLSIFCLSGLTAVFSDLAYKLGPAFYFLFYLFPVEFAMNQALADYSFDVIKRMSGFAVAGSAGYFFMMVRFGIRGIFDLYRPWRLVCFLAFVGMSLLGGFRSLVFTFMVHFVVQFCFEGLVRTRLSLFLLLGGLLAGVFTIPLVHKMPLSVQRCFAFIPGLEVNPIAKMDADATARWRIEMWKVVLPEVPKYLILGKGYAINPTDLYLANQAMQRGLAKNWEVSVVAGGYHNGPLSVIIPFGIFGTIGFVWFICAGIWVLYRNYRYGDPELRLINTFLLAFFVMRLVIFCTIFGALESDFYRFIGVLALGVSINGGVRKRPESPEPSLAMAPQPAPA